MRLGVHTLVGLATAMGIVPTGPTQAQEASPLELTWAAPSDCPQRDEVTRRLDGLLAAWSHEGKASRLRAEGRIEPFRERYRLALVIHDGSAVGTRVIASDSCEDLGGAAAVVLALLVRVERSTRGRLSESTLGGAPEQPPTSPTATQSPLQPAPAENPDAAEPFSERRWHFVARAPSFGIDIGVLPRPNYGLGLAVGLDRQPWRVLVGGRAWLWQSIPVSGFPGFSVNTSRSSLDLEGCRVWHRGQYELSPCALITLDHMSAKGDGPRVESRTGRTTWLSPGLALVGGWRFSPFMSLVMRIDGRLTTSRPRLLIDGVGEIHQVPSAAGGALFACEWFF